MSTWRYLRISSPTERTLDWRDPVMETGAVVDLLLKAISTIAGQFLDLHSLELYLQEGAIKWNQSNQLK